jgi:hypothetical protein
MMMAVMNMSKHGDLAKILRHSHLVNRGKAVEGRIFQIGTIHIPDS